MAPKPRTKPIDNVPAIDDAPIFTDLTLTESGRAKMAAHLSQMETPVTEPTEQPAEQTAPTFSYEETEVPTETRLTGPNPHQAGIDRAIELKGKGKALKFPSPAKDVLTNINWLRSGASTAGASMIVRTYNGTEKLPANVKELRDAIGKLPEDAKVTVEFWAVEKIGRKRQPATAAEAGPEAVPAGTATEAAPVQSS